MRAGGQRDAVEAERGEALHMRRIRCHRCAQLQHLVRLEVSALQVNGHAAGVVGLWPPRNVQLVPFELGPSLVDGRLATRRAFAEAGSLEGEQCPGERAEHGVHQSRPEILKFTCEGGSRLRIWLP
eukprot:scaffold46604_cov33-Phaeocystis_antarctica.AAC.2